MSSWAYQHLFVSGITHRHTHTSGARKRIRAATGLEAIRLSIFSSDPMVSRTASMTYAESIAFVYGYAPGLDVNMISHITDQATGEEGLPAYLGIPTGSTPTGSSAFMSFLT